MFRSGISSFLVCSYWSSVATGETPLATLRPIFLHLRDPARISKLHSRILEVLYQAPSQEKPPNGVIPVITSQKTADISRELRSSLAAHLFGWDFVHLQRLRYSVASFCKVRVRLPIHSF